VTTADADARALLPSDDTAVRAHPGSVACAVHASGKDALEVAAEIARASSARLPDRAEDIAPALRDTLTERGGRFNLIIDALDEAATPADARTIILKVLLPLAETCSDIGVQVVVGSRGHDDDGHLLGSFGEAITVIDLDSPQYFAEVDLAAYAKANLQLVGDERPNSPYRDDAIASTLALRIAKLADRNFLIGGLVARAHGLYDQRAADPEYLGFTPTVGSALTAFLGRISTAKQFPPRLALTALALAEAPGWPIELWRLAIEAIGGIQVTTEQLSHFARSAAANFLIETGVDGAVFRLFHQALNEALLQERSRIVPREEDEQALYQTFVRLGRERAWVNAPAYLLRSLGNHAVGAGMIDELLSEEAYLLNADLRRLMPLAEQAVSRPARLSTRLMRLTPQAVTADPSTRRALFSVTSVLEDLGRSYSDPSAPYRATWASVIPHSERAILDDQSGEVSGICAFTVNNQIRLATVGKDSAVRIWDPSTGQLLSVLAGHTDWVRAICPFDLDGQALLATGGDDRSVRIWDPSTGRLRAVLESQTHMPEAGESLNQGTIYALCAFAADKQVLLASAGAYQGIRIWDPITCRLQFSLNADVPEHDQIKGLCAFNLKDQTVLAAAHGNGTIRIWDLTTQRQLATLQGHTGVVKWACPFMASEQVLLASAGGDGTVRIWDPATGQQQTTLEGHSGWVNGVCYFTIDDHVLLASVGADGTVRIWDPPIRQRRTTTRSSASLISGVCEFTLGGQVQLATAGADGTIRVWDAVTGHQQATLDGHNSASSVCALTLAGQVRLASAGEDGTVRIWDPAGSKMMKVLQAHDSLVYGLCAFELDGQARLASGGADRAVRIWDPVSGQLKTALEGHVGGVNSVCAFTLGDQILLVSASADQTARVWHPAEGLLTVLNGHSDWVSDVTAFSLGDLVLLATASLDRTVRIFDPLSAICLGSIPVHHAAQAICSTGKLLAIGLSAGLVTIELAEDVYMPWP
jgi:WD40 repeat protein